MMYLALCGLFAHAFATVLLLVWLNVAQPFALTSLFQVSTNDLGKVSANLSLADELLSIVALFVAGTVSDTIGRIPVTLFGYLMIAIANFSLPPTAVNPNTDQVFPNYLMIRLTYAVGSSCLASMLSCHIADIHDQTKVRLPIIVSMVAIGSGFGALVGVFILGSLPGMVCIQGSYNVMGGISLLFGGIVCGLIGYATLKRNNNNNNNNDDDDEQVKETKRCSFESVFGGCVLLRGNPRLGLAYFSGFAARGGAVLVTSFFSIWISGFYVESSICFDEKFLLPNGELNETAVLEEATTKASEACQQELFNQGKFECRNAFTRTAIVGGIAQTFALIGTVVFGIMLIKMKLFKREVIHSIVLASILGMISYGAIALINDPRLTIVMVFAGFSGFAEIAMIIASQILVVSLMNKTNRGKIAGTFGFFGGIGVMFISYVGGRLFDSWKPNAPFAIMSIMNALVFVLSVILLKFTQPLLSEMNFDVDKEDNPTQPA